MAAQDEEKPYYLFAMFALNIGARVAEILALRHRDVSLELRQLHINRTFEKHTNTVVERTKAGVGVSRRIGINDNLYHAILTYQKSLKTFSPDDLIFRENGIVNYDNYLIYKKHMRLCKTAGIKKNPSS